MKRKYAVCIFALMLAASIVSAALPMPAFGQPKTETFIPGKCGFAVRIDNLENRYHRMSFFLMPRVPMDFQIIDGLPGSYDITFSDGKLVMTNDRQGKWHPPLSSGIYTLSIHSAARNEKMDILGFVMVPLDRVDRNGYLNGYRIGAYPAIPLKQLPIYKPPKGLIEIHEDSIDMAVSPHFHLGQFICKQAGGYPKYMLLQTRLLMKLELILAELNLRGYRCDTFVVLSGYRTPFYNRSIGNVKYSRHLWGGAADIFVDQNPRDNYMDDLNRDGHIDWKDAEIVYDIVDALYGRPFYEPFIGGLGWYRKNNVRGPFVHIDVRGHRARWGD